METLPTSTEKDRCSELHLKLFDADREARLSDMALFGRSTKVFFIYNGK